MDITKELTIVIPVRIDSIERKENLDTVISFFMNYTFAHLIVLEGDDKQRYKYNKTERRLSQHFIKDNDPIFHRTRYLNQLLKLSKTNIVGVWDTDVLVRSSQIIHSVNAIKAGSTMSFPYDGRFLFVDVEKSIEFRKDCYSFMENYQGKKIRPISWRPSVGGAFIVNRDKYLKAGGENETFYGWGPEDVERVKRMEILGERIDRVNGLLFHLHHPRYINSLPIEGAIGRNNTKELLTICQMSRDSLIDYIKKWPIKMNFKE
ncbi:N-terminal domain of galactosyltransferase [Porphyromonadaceae bacterium KH3R12]|nr:N-terminal domain of galactosyltransferase [Porphyromonadaceae bacterium KH3R12]